MVALLTYTSNDEDVTKGSDRKKSKIQTHWGSLGTSVTTGCGGGKKEELSDTHISGLDNQLGVAHGDTEGSTYETEIIFFGGSWGKDKKNSILIILTFEVLIGHLGGAILHVGAKGVK